MLALRPAAWILDTARDPAVGLQDQALPGDLSPPQVGHPSGVTYQMPEDGSWVLGARCGAPLEVTSKSCSDLGPNHLHGLGRMLSRHATRPTASPTVTKCATLSYGFHELH